MFYVPFKYVQMTHQCLSCQYCIFFPLDLLVGCGLHTIIRCLADFLAPSILVRKWFKNVKKKEDWGLRASGSFFLLVRTAVIMVINFSAMQRKALLLEKEIFFMCAFETNWCFLHCGWRVITQSVIFSQKKKILPSSTNQGPSCNSS